MDLQASSWLGSAVLLVQSKLNGSVHDGIALEAGGKDGHMAKGRDEFGDPDRHAVAPARSPGLFAAA